MAQTLEEILNLYAEYYHLKILNRFTDEDMHREFPTEIDESKATQAIRQAVEEIVGEDTHIHDGAAGDEATWEGAQNALRAEVRANLMKFIEGK